MQPTGGHLGTMIMWTHVGLRASPTLMPLPTFKLPPGGNVFNRRGRRNYSQPSKRIQRATSGFEQFCHRLIREFESWLRLIR